MLFPTSYESAVSIYSNRYLGKMFYLINFKSFSDPALHWLAVLRISIRRIRIIFLVPDPYKKLAGSGINDETFFGRMHTSTLVKSLIFLHFSIC